MGDLTQLIDWLEMAIIFLVRSASSLQPMASYIVGSSQTLSPLQARTVWVHPVELVAPKFSLSAVTTQSPSSQSTTTPPLASQQEAQAG